MISYQSLPLQQADASIVVSLAGFTLIVAAGVQPRKIFRNTRPCISLWENYGNRGRSPLGRQLHAAPSVQPRNPTLSDNGQRSVEIRSWHELTTIRRLPNWWKTDRFEEERKRVEKLFSSRFFSKGSIEDICRFRILGMIEAFVFYFFLSVSLWGGDLKG